jgi:hypothetical protein
MVLALSQEYAHLIVLAGNVLHRATFAISNEYIHPSTYGQLD